MPLLQLPCFTFYKDSPVQCSTQGSSRLLFPKFQFCIPFSLKGSPLSKAPTLYSRLHFCCQGAPNEGEGKEDLEVGGTSPIWGAGHGGAAKASLKHNWDRQMENTGDANQH